MRVLMLAHRLPYPPWTGDRVRAYHIAQHLARRHHLTLACPLEGRSELGAVQKLRELIRDLEYAPLGRFRRRASALLGLAGALPLSVRYFASRPLALRLRQRLLAERFDLIYVSSSSMAHYALGHGVPLLMDFVDVDSEKWSQYAARALPPIGWLYRLEASRLQVYEREIAGRARVSVFATRVEESIFRRNLPTAQTTVVPNGVDIGYFHPSGNGHVKEPTVIFTGALDYFPNIDGVRHFARTVFPRVRTRIPKARFLVVGRRPSRDVLQLGRLPGITVVGGVPDVRPYMNEAAVAVVPLRIARGIQNKVLEAMAMGLPVVVTPQPAQGIEARPGIEWFVEETDTQLAERLIGLLQDPGTRTEVGARARAFVTSHHSWQRILSHLDSVVEGAAP